MPLGSLMLNTLVAVKEPKQNDSKILCKGLVYMKTRRMT
jgi:hypothetical protein